MTTFLLVYIIVMLAVGVSVIIGAVIIIKKFNIKLTGGSDGTTRVRIESEQPRRASERE